MAKKTDPYVAALEHELEVAKFNGRTARIPSIEAELAAARRGSKTATIEEATVDAPKKAVRRTRKA